MPPQLDSVLSSAAARPRGTNQHWRFPPGCRAQLTAARSWVSQLQALRDREGKASTSTEIVQRIWEQGPIVWEGMRGCDMLTAGLVARAGTIATETGHHYLGTLRR